MQPGDVEHDAAGDQRRVLLDAALLPHAAAEVLVGRPAVPEHAEVAEVVERVDVRPGVDVHVDRVAAVAVLLVHVRAGAGEVVDDRALRRVRHPDLVLRVLRRGPRRHPEEVFDAEVEHGRAVEPLEDGLLRRGRDPVEAADLVLGPHGLRRHLHAVAIEQRVVRQALALRHARLRRRSRGPGSSRLLRPSAGLSQTRRRGSRRAVSRGVGRSYPAGRGVLRDSGLAAPGSRLSLHYRARRTARDRYVRPSRPSRQ